MGSKNPVLLLRLQASYENGEQQRTSVKRWMMDNYDDLTAKFDEMFPNGRINWIWLTSWLQDNGFRNRDGSDLKKHTVKETWRRVVEDRAKRRPRRIRQVQEIGDTATAVRNEVFRQPVAPVAEASASGEGGAAGFPKRAAGDAGGRGCTQKELDGIMDDLWAQLKQR